MTIDSADTTLNSVQQHVLQDLLAVGGDRPVASEGLVHEIEQIISDIAGPAVSTWHEPYYFLGKSGFTTVQKCEGMVVAEAERVRSTKLPMPTAVGIVTHRAIQMTQSHEELSPVQLVRAAIFGSLEETAFAAMMAEASEWERCDLESQCVNKLVSFLDSFPPLQENWVPRFEVSYSAKIGGLSMAGKPDLTLGRPRNDGKQTMFICDFKTGSIREEHLQEARFYALLATLRNGVPPFRSCVYSLASGEWTDPTITADILLETAEDVANAVVNRISVLTGLKEALLVPDRYCSWCPAANSCPASSAPKTESVVPDTVSEIQAAFAQSEPAVEAPVLTVELDSSEDNPYEID